MAREFLTNINLNKNELQNAAIQTLAVAPSSPVVGQIYFDTVSNNLRQYDGTQWLDYITAEAGGGYITSTTTDFTVTTGELAINYSNLESALTGDGFATTSDISTAIGGLSTVYDAYGAASTAQSNAESYTDTAISGLSTVYDAYGAASTAQSNAESYTDTAISGLSTVYDAYGAASTVQGNLDDHTGASTGVHGVTGSVVGTTDSQTLTNKTIDSAIVTGTTSFRDSNNVEGLTIDVSTIGTAHLIAADDLSLRATNDIVLYPGNDAGGHTGKAYIHWGNDATSAHPEREIATVGTSQTFSNKQVSDGFIFNDGVNANSQVTIYSGNLTVSGGSGLYLAAQGADVTLQPDGIATVWGDQILTANATQTINYKTLGAGTLLGANLDAANTYTIAGLVNPTNSQDAATKAYVDASSQGLSVLGSVITASDEAIDVTQAVTGTIGGVAVGDLQDGARVLLKEQPDYLNGIYIWNTTTQMLTASTTPSDTNLKNGSYVLVTEGNHAAQGWIIVDNDPTLSNPEQSIWVQFSAAGEYTAGNGIDITDGAVSVKIDGDTLSESGSGLKVSYQTSGGLDTDGGLYVKTANGVTIDGSGYVTIDTTVVARKYSESNGALTASGGLVTWPVTHSLSTRNVTVQVFDLDTYEQVEVDVTRTSTSVVTLSWVSGDVSANAYQVVVVG